MMVEPKLMMSFILFVKSRILYSLLNIDSAAERELYEICEASLRVLDRSESRINA